MAAGKKFDSTYGQDNIETRATPIMMAALTRKAMRKAVRRPPHMTPSHIYNDFSDSDRFLDAVTTTNL